MDLSDLAAQTEIAVQSVAFAFATELKHNLLGNITLACPIQP